VTIAKNIGASENQWWRWPLVPIAAIGGSVLGSALFGLIQWFGMKLQGGFSEDGWMYQYILPVLTSAIFGWLFIYISCAVAPRGKLITGTVMTTLLVLLGIANLFLVWGLQRYGTGESVRLTITSIVTSIAGIASLIQAHNEYRS
jgi:hypothetical protein